jgi:hypothetical protein
MPERLGKSEFKCQGFRRPDRGDWKSMRARRIVIPGYLSAFHCASLSNWGWHVKRISVLFLPHLHLLSFTWLIAHIAYCLCEWNAIGQFVSSLVIMAPVSYFLSTNSIAWTSGASCRATFSILCSVTPTMLDLFYMPAVEYWVTNIPGCRTETTKTTS